MEEQTILQTVTYPVYLLQGLSVKFQIISSSQMATCYVLNQLEMGHPRQGKNKTK